MYESCGHKSKLVTMNQSRIPPLNNATSELVNQALRSLEWKRTNSNNTGQVNRALLSSDAIRAASLHWMPSYETGSIRGTFAFGERSFSVRSSSSSSTPTSGRVAKSRVLFKCVSEREVADGLEPESGAKDTTNGLNHENERQNNGRNSSQGQQLHFHYQIMLTYCALLNLHHWSDPF